MESLLDRSNIYMSIIWRTWRPFGGPGTEGEFILSEVPNHADVPSSDQHFHLELLENLCKLEELMVEDCPGLVSLVSCKHSAWSEIYYYFLVLRKMLLAPSPCALQPLTLVVRILHVSVLLPLASPSPLLLAPYSSSLQPLALSERILLVPVLRSKHTPF